MSYQYKPSDFWLSFDGMTWPDQNDPANIVHRLTWDANDDAARRVAVSYVSAYCHLVQMPKRRRDEIVASLRAEAAKKPVRVEGES